MILQGRALIENVKSIITIAEKMRCSYFFDSPGEWNACRQYEIENSFPEVKWFEGGHEYSAEYRVRCSLNNVYARGYYSKDGKKTNLKTIRNSLIRLEAA